ncbi:MAG: hypothetical protein R6X02_11925 [Enhygromyxa sp.]
MEDPELQRVTELLARERSGSLDDAGREELALYGDQAELVEQAHARVPALLVPGGSDDRTWLARVRDDEALVRANSAPRTRLERGVGVAMIAGGWVVSVLGSPIGAVLAGAGAALVLASFIRVRLAQRRDPYDEIKR